MNILGLLIATTGKGGKYSPPVGLTSGQGVANGCIALNAALQNMFDNNDKSVKNAMQNSPSSDPEKIVSNDLYIPVEDKNYT